MKQRFEQNQNPNIIEYDIGNCIILYIAYFGHPINLVCQPRDLTVSKLTMYTIGQSLQQNWYEEITL